MLCATPESIILSCLLFLPLGPLLMCEVKPQHDLWNWATIYSSVLAWEWINLCCSFIKKTFAAVSLNGPHPLPFLGPRYSIFRAHPSRPQCCHYHDQQGPCARLSSPGAPSVSQHTTIWLHERNKKNDRQQRNTLHGRGLHEMENRLRAVLDHIWCPSTTTDEDIISWWRPHSIMANLCDTRWGSATTGIPLIE